MRNFRPALLLLLGTLTLGACDRGEERERVDLSAAPDVLPEVEAVDPVPLEGSAMPDPEAAPQACTEDIECRSWRPASWNPRVECCYEYACDLDWRPIHLEQWQGVRAWRRANPFDCSRELQQGGPCTQGVTCPLQAEPPPARCHDGECVLDWPERWPIPDPRGQTCSVSADCMALPESAFSQRRRCCDMPCAERGWIPLRNDAARAVERWLENDPIDCARWQDRDGECAEPRPCSELPPPVTCRAGFCALYTP